MYNTYSIHISNTYSVDGSEIWRAPVESECQEEGPLLKKAIVLGVTVTGRKNALKDQSLRILGKLSL